MDSKSEKLARELTEQFTNEGKIIDAGFASLCLLAYKDADAAQIKEMRQLFFAGAHHLFASILSVLEPGEEPTDKDLLKFDLIQAELDKFIADFKTNIETVGGAQ